MKMKIGGKEVNGPTEEVLVLPRSNGDIVFRARAVLDMKEFDAQVPLPKAPGRLTKDGFKPNTDDPNFKVQAEHYASLRMAYICIRSLEPSEIEWEKVKIEDPGTWLLWDEDLRDAGFSGVELQRVLLCCMAANSLDEAKLRDARDSFLLGQVQEQVKSSGQDTAPPSTQSGKVVNG